MAHSTTIRVGAAACLALALLSVIVAYPALFNGPSYGPDDFRVFDEAVFSAQIAAVALILLALRGVHAPPAPSWGRLGRAAFGVTMLGCGLLAGKEMLIFLNYGVGLPLTQGVVTAVMAPATVLVLIGAPLLIIAVVRAGAIPRVHTITVLALLTVAVVMSAALPPPTGTIVTCVGLVAAAAALYAESLDPVPV